MTTPGTHVYDHVDQDSVWQPQIRGDSLLADEVHIWLADLDLEVFALPKYLRDLSLTERTRAQRLRFDHDRRRFVVAKGLLRQLIGEYLRIDPHDIQFTPGPSGKPELAKRLQDHHGPLCFNQAHSSHMGIFAFCRNRRVGIDLEEIRPFHDLHQIAELLFSSCELEAFRRLPEEEEKKQAFFMAWTHKEAFVKALGKGISLPLSHFEISRLHTDLSRVVQNHHHPPDQLEWFIRNIPISPQFAAAVCVEGDGWSLRCCKW